MLFGLSPHLPLNDVWFALGNRIKMKIVRFIATVHLVYVSAMDAIYAENGIAQLTLTILSHKLDEIPVMTSDLQRRTACTVLSK